MEGEVFQGNTNISNDSYMLQKRLEIMNDINNKKVANELAKINSMVNKLNDDICEIRKVINSMLRTDMRERTDIREYPISESNDKNRNNLNNKKDNKETIKPRYGDYKSEDVAIDKMFYFGNKK